MIRAGVGAATTPPSSQSLPARFSRLVTTPKYFAGSTSNCSLPSWPITPVAWPPVLPVPCSGLAARRAGSLLRRASDHSLHARQRGGQLLSAGMFAAPLLFHWRRQRLALALRLDFGVAHSSLKLQQLELRIAELFAAWAILLDPLQAQLLFQYLDLQFGPSKFLPQIDYLLGFGKRNGTGTRHVR